MNNIFYKSCILIVLTLYGCSDREVQKGKDIKEKRVNKITKIVFATGGCYGECPVMAFEIDSSLLVKFHGVKYTHLNGFYIGKTTSGYWDSLNLRLEDLKFRELDSAYFNSVDDLSTEMYVYYDNGKIKYMEGQSGSLPLRLMGFYNYLMNSILRIDFEQTNDSLVFITKRQIPLNMPIVYLNE